MLKTKNKQMVTLEVDKIKKYFPFHRVCLVKTLVILVSCILFVNNCNLNKAKKKGSLALGRIVNIETVYTRFIRFFKIKNSLVFVVCILRLVQHLLSDYINKEEEYTLSIDRTNWKLGIVNINMKCVKKSGQQTILNLWYEKIATIRQIKFFENYQ